MRLTVQLYTLRDALESDWAGTLAKVREIGLEYVELAGFYGKSATEWRTKLDELGLKASGAHIGLDALENSLETTIADVKTIGFDYVIVPWVGEEAYANGWAAFGAKLAPIGDRLRQEGLTLCYHNHDFEFKNGDGLSDLYGATTGDQLQAEIDAAWVKIGGYDPAETIRGLAGRVPLVHGKDYDATRSPQWVPAGQGTVDLPEVLSAAEASGVRFVGIELDAYAGDPLDAVAQSFAYYQSQGLS